MLSNKLRKPEKTTFQLKSKLVLMFTIFLAICLGLFSCEGPVGPEGPPGPPGPSGAVGPAGADGNLMHAGDGEPESDLGDLGDFYLDLSSGDLYGPKDNQGWGTPVNLSGADGQDGKDGSQIHAGDGPPDAELGDEGDYYLDRENYQLYGPKSGEDWGDPIHLQGPEGEPGADGVSGWERIVESRTMGPSTFASFVVACPEGKVPVGGGFDASFFDVIVYKSHPTSNNQWLITARNTNETLNRHIVGYVICIYDN
jgi:hypothetical protein